MATLRVLALVISAMVALLMPIREWLPVSRAVTASDPMMVLGNSVIRHSSRCDTDQRSIPQMMSELARKPVLDLSESGRQLEQSINLAATAITRGKTRQVILTFALFDLADLDVSALSEALLHRALNPELNQVSLGVRLTLTEPFRTLLEGRPAPTRSAFEFKGSQYPEYSGIKRDFFSVEKRAMPCPENDGQNLKFIEAYHAAQYLKAPIEMELLDELGRLAGIARRSHVRLDVVLMPLNMELMRGFDPRMAQQVNERLAMVRNELGRRGVQLTDLSSALPNSGFADRWCACGHLLQEGREQVARLLAAR